MDLTPLYTLRERLKAGAVAGTALLPEDFRLARALEALAPLESAAPVFARIGQGTRALLDPACPDRAAALLDVLALCDAVLVTQGAVQAEGELSPLPLTAHGAVLSNAPHSVLQPLLDALAGSGGGRYAFVADTHEQSPELFRDYRVQQALVGALGAGYAELADLAEEWLCGQGPEIVPLLKEGFDPAGKREMARRLHVMETVAGAAENAFYLSLLESGGKEVRAAAAYALRLDAGNAAALLTLVKTERGAVKKQAQWALARMEAPEAWAYWNELAAKKPEQAAEFLVGSPARQAGELTAALLGRLLEPFEADAAAELTAETAARLAELPALLAGKSGEAIGGLYRRCAALGDRLDRPPAGTKEPLLLRPAIHEEPVPFSRAIPRLLTESLKLSPAPDLAALAASLDEAYGGDYRAARVMAALLTRPAAEAYDLAAPLLKPAGGLFKKKKPDAAPLRLTAGAVFWNDKTGRQEAGFAYVDPMTKRTCRGSRPLREPLDFRWYADLAALGGQAAGILAANIRPDDEPLRRLLIPFFLARQADAPEDIAPLDALRRLGHDACEGMAVRYCRGQKRLYVWQLRTYFEHLPGGREQKAAEAGRVLRLAEAGTLKLTGPHDLDNLRELAAAYGAPTQTKG